MSRSTPIRLLVHGARGKMGARIAALARDDARFNVAAAVDVHDSGDADRLAPGSIDAIIDFSSDQGAQRAAALARTLRCALLVGTTGLSGSTLDAIDQCTRSVAVMVAANTSLGVAVLNHLVTEAARLLGQSFDIDLVESHHTAKRDAPSGTALRLAQSLRERANIDLPPQRIHSLRAGDIIGEHTIRFAGPGEILTISHQATNRDLFARGALRAAAWLAGKPPGRYTIEQSLGLK